MISQLLAPNPGPMTLTGTNTWLVSTPDMMIIVDPGPDDHDHLQRIVAMVGSRPRLILVTHRHADHTAAIDPLRQQLDCLVRAADPQWCRGAAPLVDGEVIGDLEVLHTPGHTDDSVCFITPTALLSGDTVLGSGSTMISHPEGNLADYFTSLDRIEQAVSQVSQILPGHGPVIDDPLGVVGNYRQHRLDRLAQVRDAYADGARTAAEVVASVYGELDHGLVKAATSSVRAQLDHLGLLAEESS